MAKERTIEIINYCPFGCSYCSSDTLDDAGMETGDFHEMLFQDVTARMHEAKGQGIELLHISGGEPMIHDAIGWIMLEARHLFGRGVILHTNLIPQIGYNPNICEGIRIHAYMTPDQVDEVHVLKRIEQGRESRAAILRMKEEDHQRVLGGKPPKVHCSANWHEACLEGCDHLVIKPDNTIVRGPCRKFDSV